MIYALEFDKYFEGREYYGNAQSTLMSIYDVYRRRGIKCLLMYKYKLPNLERDWINPKKLQDKYCFNNPEKIDFSKIDCDYVMLYHTEIYQNDWSQISKLFEFCIKNNKDLFIPLRSLRVWPKDKSIRNELNNFEHQLFTISELQDQFRFEKVLTRHLKLNDLLNEKDT